MRRPGVARTFAAALALSLLGLATLGAAVAWLNLRGEAPIDRTLPTTPAAAELVERGAYLARAGNCIGCHTASGGAPLAGGRGIETPFGVVVAPNLTPDANTGLGQWSADEFWRALHHGRARDGRLLYPAFPYPSFSVVTRADSDALYAYLRSVPAVAQANAPHALRFPYGTQAALALWRALYFRPGEFRSDAQQDAAWNRGKYLVQGLGHCAACHSGRDRLGGIVAPARFAGGLMPGGAWYAPSLATPAEAGVQGWQPQQVVRLLRDGVSAQASVSGPMADVVFTGTQYLSDTDLAAMARYLASIPRREPAARAVEAAAAEVLARGDALYAQHCASCHGDAGQGVAGIYPALAGNRALTLAMPHNLVQVIRHGGFPPSTAGNPRPFGMPPFGQLLDDAEIAALITFMRQSWGHRAAPVSALDVLRIR
ncbi:MAG TPA: cytochrome c [Rubrivivax sp.]|nr:cytochrome c [Burkholderiales bacterium]HNT37787.1 cytochrome c [Rubrivivax sp.]